jgi:alcohol dehydrogenase (cytochrome c)
MNARLLALIFAVAAAATLTAQSTVTWDRLLKTQSEPHNWLTYSGDLFNQRHSRLTQITPNNVRDLELAWVWQARSLEKYEATSIVNDGILYTVQAPNDLVALDAVTGRPFWTYAHAVPATARVCCGRVNRGVAIADGKVFMATVDSQLLAVDAKSGQLVWKTAVTTGDPRFSMTLAPQIVKDKVIVGTAGGDMGIRAFIAAYDLKTGKEVWRFYTIPAPGEPGNETWAGESWKEGGAAIWNIGAYDPELNLTYWGTGNPYPDWDGRNRRGDNLYSDSVVALDADSGTLRWHYQFTPHDEIDYDSTQVPILADVQYEGKPRKVMMWANRNGIMYLLDRVTGQFLKGQPYVAVNWMNGFDAKGRPNRLPDKIPSPEGTLLQPTVFGGTNWAPASYSPRTGLFYVAVTENSSTLAVLGEFPRTAGQNPRAYPMGATNLTQNYNHESESHGAIRAYDPLTLEKKWEFPLSDITWAGTLTTATDLVFSGGKEGVFLALDARSGKLLWKASLGGQVNSGPMSYAVNGRQYVAVAAGSSLFAFTLRQ